VAADLRYHAMPCVLMRMWWDNDGAAAMCTAFLPKCCTVPVLVRTVQRCEREPSTTCGRSTVRFEVLPGVRCPPPGELRDRIGTWPQKEAMIAIALTFIYVYSE
jgi:hypothetical protein